VFLFLALLSFHSRSTPINFKQLPQEQDIILVIVCSYFFNVQFLTPQCLLFLPKERHQRCPQLFCFKNILQTFNFVPVHYLPHLGLGSPTLDLGLDPEHVRHMEWN